MSLHYGLLGLLNYADATGYELKKAFDESLNFFWNAHKSQIYKELAAMEKKGLLDVRLVVQHDKPNKKVYSITDEGRMDFISWLEKDLEDQDFVIRETFLMKVFFWGELSSGQAIEKLRSYIERHRKALESYRGIPASVDAYSPLVDRRKLIFWQFTAKHGFAYSETCIAWAQEAIELLNGGTDA